jgi:hypothetical protein
MKLDLIKMLLNGAKNLMGKQTTKDILRYLATATLGHAARKYGINQYKYDSNDMKNMVYHYNMNNNQLINKNDVDTMIDIMSINRFMNELPQQNEIIDDPMTKLIETVSDLSKDNQILRTYNNMLENSVITQFDYDTLETSGIVDSYEINSGGIYVPDRNVNIITNEGFELANAKNDYLEKRMELGNNPSEKIVNELIKEFYEKIDFDNMIQYFNN